MDSDEVLRRSRNSGGDEGKDATNRWADGYGFLALCIGIILLTVYKSLQGLPAGDVLSLSFIFLSAGMLARYRRDRERFPLVFGILSTVIAVVLLASFLAKTW